MKMILHIHNEEEFESVIHTYPLVLVDFFASWCGPCRMLSPVLEEIDDKGESKAMIVKVDTDLESNASLCQRFKVRSIPTLILFQDGKEKETKIGFLPKNQILELINA